MDKRENLVIGSVISLLLIIFVLLNTRPVIINFSVVKPKLSSTVALAIMTFLGVLVSWLMGERSQNNQKGSWGSFKRKNGEKTSK